MRTTLLVDLGKTRCRVVVEQSDGRRQTAEVGGTSGMADREGVAAAVRALASASADLVDPYAVDAVVVGAAGMGRTSIAATTHEPRADALLDALRAVYRHASLAVCSDMTTSHIGGLGGRPGVVLAVGTGTVALGVAGDGAFAVVDGWGYLLGDDGSGSAIGRAGLSAALRWHDGRGGSADLAGAARRRYGSLDDLPALIHGSPNPVAAIAAFAPDVLEAAAAGDATSASICDGAVAALAATARAASAACGLGATDIAVVGGLVGDDRFRDVLALALSTVDPPMQWIPPGGDALAGAHLLASTCVLPHERLVRRRDVGE